MDIGLIKYFSTIIGIIIAVFGLARIFSPRIFLTLKQYREDLRERNNRTDKHQAEIVQMSRDITAKLIHVEKELIRQQEKTQAMDKTFFEFKNTVTGFMEFIQKNAGMFIPKNR